MERFDTVNHSHY